MKYVVMILLAALVTVLLRFGCGSTEQEISQRRAPLKKLEKTEKIEMKKALRLVRPEKKLFKLRPVTMKKPKVKQKVTLSLTESQIYTLKKALSLRYKRRPGYKRLRRMANDIKSNSSRKEQLALYNQARKVLEVKPEVSFFKRATSSIGEVITEEKGWMKWVVYSYLSFFFLKKFIGAFWRGTVPGFRKKEIIVLLISSGVLYWVGESFQMISWVWIGYFFIRMSNFSYVLIRNRNV